METNNIQKANVPLKMKNFIPFYGLLDYARRCDNTNSCEHRGIVDLDHNGLDYCIDSTDDVTNRTVMKQLALIGYNFAIFSALALETANGLVKLLQ